jgi:hypothetical protein
LSIRKYEPFLNYLINNYLINLRLKGYRYGRPSLVSIIAFITKIIYSITIAIKRGMPIRTMLSKLAMMVAIEMVI